MTEHYLARGFRFAGIHAGVREAVDRADLALIVSETPCRAVGVFTQNQVVAAPVKVCRERLPSGDLRGVVVCAGNANACTGEQGLADARRMSELLAAELSCEARQVLVASTGVIGVPLPMPALENGIPKAVACLADTGRAFESAAKAITTTDSRAKVATRRLDAVAGGPYYLSGMAKGAAMIGPNLATMLAFVCTDAPVAEADLGTILGHAVHSTFNCISVEGHTSTNDTVLLLANGSDTPLTGADLQAFSREVTQACADLARMIAGDAEGAEHLVVIHVEGATADEDARRIAKTIAESALVKTAIHGADPNWGRIISAAGYAGVPFHETELSLWLGDLPLYQQGTPLPFDAATASAYLKQQREVHLRLRVGHGPGICTFYTCDLTAEYIRLNAEYTT